MFPPLSYPVRYFCKPIHALATCFHSGFLLVLFSDPEDGRDIFTRNIGFLRGAVSHKGLLFIATAVRTSNRENYSCNQNTPPPPHMKLGPWNESQLGLCLASPLVTSVRVCRQANLHRPMSYCLPVTRSCQPLQQVLT
jgi:hypothetical protein